MEKTVALTFEDLLYAQLPVSNYHSVLFQVKIWFQNRRMKWRNSKERELIAQGGCREQTLPTKNNPNPDLSDPQSQRPHQPPNSTNSINTVASNHLEAMAKTRLAFNETLWTLPPPLHQGSNLNNPINNNVDQDDIASENDDEIHDEGLEDDMDEDDEEINVT